MYEHLTNKPELARVVADITGDGHLQIKDWRHLVSFYSKETEEIEAMKKKFYDLFQVVGRVYLDNRKNVRYKLFFISKPVALFLRDVGTPVGNKTNLPFSVPGWIFNGSDEVKAAYLRGLFDCEGTIFCRNTLKPRWQIGFCMIKNENIIELGLLYFKQIRELLTQFKIKTSPVRIFKCNIRKDGSQSFELQFNIEKSSFEQFHRYVGFDNKNKREKLISALNTFT